jgi:hypothetical protein
MAEIDPGETRIMPQVLLPLIAFLGTPITIAGVELGITFGQAAFLAAPISPCAEIAFPDDVEEILFPADETCAVQRHVWPVSAASKGELISVLSGAPDVSTPEVRAYVHALATRLAHLSEKSVGELHSMVDTVGRPSMDVTMNIVPAMDPLRAAINAEKPGLFDRLIAEGKWPYLAFGFCLDPIIPEGSLIFTDDQAPISRGDVVGFMARGTVAQMMKVFLGEKDGIAYFCAPKPPCLMEIEVGNLIHVTKITTIKQARARAREIGDVRPFLPALARQRMDSLPARPFEAPKATNALWAIETAYQDIREAFRSLPPDTPSPVNSHGLRF